MLKRIYIAFVLSISSIYTHAEPFINTSDLSLRASLQHLSNEGLINIPLNTYPLMWTDVKAALRDIKITTLTTTQKASYQQIYHASRKAPHKHLLLKANGATEKKRFTSFGDSFRDKNNITVSASQVFNTVAYKLSPSISASDSDGDKLRFDDSYLAFKFNNWNLSLGTQDRWWGPGWDSNIGLTNNARPMLSAAITRNISKPFVVPFTENYSIPWNVTSFMGMMEKDRHVPNTLLWGFRLSFIPVKNLEISLIRLAQWGGDGRSKSLRTFADVLTGKDNCGVDGLDCGENSINEPGNQQAGYDLRYSFNIFNLPMSFYGQYFGEDGKADAGLDFITKPAIQLGFDGNFSLFSQPVTAFIEYTDTYKTCGTNDIIGNCFFEHHIYQTGMRYKGRNIGHLYDNDAESYVIGVIGQNYNDVKWDVRLRYVKLNVDDSDRFPNNIKGNTLTEVAEDLWMLSTNYEKRFTQLSYKVGIELSRSESALNDENDANASLELSYLF